MFWNQWKIKNQKYQLMNWINQKIKLNCNGSHKLLQKQNRLALGKSRVSKRIWRTRVNCKRRANSGTRFLRSWMSDRAGCLTSWMSASWVSESWMSVSWMSVCPDAMVSLSSDYCTHTWAVRGTEIWGPPFEMYGFCFLDAQHFCEHQCLNNSDGGCLPWPYL